MRTGLTTGRSTFFGLQNEKHIRRGCIKSNSRVHTHTHAHKSYLAAFSIKFINLNVKRTAVLENTNDIRIPLVFDFSCGLFYCGNEQIILWYFEPFCSYEFIKNGEH